MNARVESRAGAKTGRALLIGAATIAAFAFAAPRWALAQSSFAGSWAGKLVEQSSASCTCSGTGCGAPYTETCTYSIPWSGTIDAQGNVSVGFDAGTVTCSNGTSVSVPATPAQPYGTIGSNGALGVAPFNNSSSNSGVTTSVSCSGWTMQFSLSPASVSGQESCQSTVASTVSDGQGGSFTLTCTGSSTGTYSGSQSSSAPGAVQVFPITVSSNITPTSATATAQVTPPSQLVGSVASVYVFAHAPQSALASSKRRGPAAPNRPADGSTPDPCVLAQLNSSGQLVAASGSSLTAYTTGVLSSQAQSVTILNNVTTSNVAGASFYVGYGSTSGAMLSSGLYEGAVSVPGTNSCSAALLAGAAPNAPGALSGLWWNPSESGWGISFAQRRNVIFAAWYTYDTSGNPKWYVASNCAMPSGTTGTSGTCTGTLYEVSGPTFFGSSFDPTRVQASTVGSLQVNFRDANNATMSYTVNGQSRTIPIARQVFQSGSASPAVDYTDLWWNPQESGWGMAATQQYGAMFLAWFVYDGSGKPMWYVSPDCVVAGSRCSGTLYRTTGPAFGPTFDSSAVHGTAVGSVTMSFTDANNATLSYTVDGASSTKTITRQAF